MSDYLIEKLMTALCKLFVEVKNLRLGDCSGSLWVFKCYCSLLLVDKEQRQIHGVDGSNVVCR